MSPGVQSRLFEPFYTTKDLNGTGLGLWISAGIISRHQGRITFRSSQEPSHRGMSCSLFPLRKTQTPEQSLLGSHFKQPYRPLFRLNSKTRSISNA